MKLIDGTSSKVFDGVWFAGCVTDDNRFMINWQLNMLITRMDEDIT